MKCTAFLRAGGKSGKLKVISIIFWWMWSKLGNSNFVHETLKSAELVYELSLFFAC